MLRIAIQRDAYSQKITAIRKRNCERLRAAPNN